MTTYTYKVIREYGNGIIGKRAKKLYRWEPDLKVGGLYINLGDGYPGMQRIISVEQEEIPD